MNPIISRIAALPNMDFKSAATMEKIRSFEQTYSVTVPEAYKEWLLFSDGGEIFTPGVQLYGVDANPVIEKGETANVPESYFVIGRTSFGDAICFESGSEQIIQWDHEQNEEFLSWDNFFEFLKESVEDYGANV